MHEGNASLEVLRIEDRAWRVRDMTRPDHPCPVIAFIDCVDERHRVLWLDAPLEDHLYRDLAEAVGAIEARLLASRTPSRRVAE